MFSRSTVTEVTRRQRASEIFQESVYEPFKIAWSDWRTKFGLSVIFGFVVLGLLSIVSTSEFWLLEQVEIFNGLNDTGESRLRPFQDWEYPLGTDEIGRGYFALVVHAIPTMLQMIIAGSVFSTAMATLVGTVAGYKGGWTDTVLMTFTDIMMTIPGLPFVIVLVVLVNPQEPWLIGIIITINAWAGLARTIHSQVLSIREHSYVEASRTMGISMPKIIQKDILPNLMPYILVNFTNSARRVIYDSVALYFLAVLPVSRMENWGVMMNQAYNNSAHIVPGKFYQLLVPMMAIIILSLGLILFAQGTDRLFNPRVRTRHAGETKQEGDEDEDVVTPMQ